VSPKNIRVITQNVSIYLVNSPNVHRSTWEVADDWLDTPKAGHGDLIQRDSRGACAGQRVPHRSDDRGDVGGHGKAC
jgi:hypothetical protein